MKNSYYNIGGYELSLFEIENCILNNNKGTHRIYGESLIFIESDFRRKLLIEKENFLIDFGISIPTRLYYINFQIKSRFKNIFR